MFILSHRPTPVARQRQCFSQRNFLRAVLWVLAVPSMIVDGKEFSELRSIKGVSRVEFIEPYLLVQVSSKRNIQEICEKVREAVDEERDSDIAFLPRPIDLRCYDRNYYKYHKRELKRVREVESADDLEQLYWHVEFTSIYVLDWSSEQVIRSRSV